MAEAGNEGVYHNQKYIMAPDTLPNDLHWSFWKAYTTWLSGIALFVILYMVNPDFYLVSPDSPWQWAANLSGWQANLPLLLGVRAALLLTGVVMATAMSANVFFSAGGRKPLHAARQHD